LEEKAGGVTQKRVLKEVGELEGRGKKARLDHFCDKETSCYPEIYELVDNFPGNDWTNPDEPPPGIGQLESDDTTGGYAWWCRTPHAEGDYCMSARRPICPGCTLKNVDQELVVTASRTGIAGCFGRYATFYIPWLPRTRANKEERTNLPGYAIFRTKTEWKPKLKKGLIMGSGPSTKPQSKNSMAACLVQGLKNRGVELETALAHARTPFVVKLTRKDFAEWSQSGTAELHVSSSYE
jgi:hypothetical protein